MRGGKSERRNEERGNEFLRCGAQTPNVRLRGQGEKPVSISIQCRRHFHSTVARHFNAGFISMPGSKRAGLDTSNKKAARQCRAAFSGGWTSARWLRLRLARRQAGQVRRRWFRRLDKRQALRWCGDGSTGRTARRLGGFLGTFPGHWPGRT